MKTFLKIVANALGALGTAVALINPKAVFAVDQPVAFVFLLAAGGIGLVAYRESEEAHSRGSRLADLTLAPWRFGFIFRMRMTIGISAAGKVCTERLSPLQTLTSRDFVPLRARLATRGSK